MMLRNSLILLSILPVMGCVTTEARLSKHAIGDDELLSGKAIFGEVVSTAQVGDPGLFKLDDEMRMFVDKHVVDYRAERDRTRRLLRAMLESGLMSLDYDDAETKTAQETFHDRIGNCMSFTSLFVALAREAGLDVVFQIVEIPPVWYEDSNLVILNNHVNALVRQNFGSRVIVDFNTPELKGNYESRAVSDEYAMALYFNNLAMDFLREGDDEESFRHLRKSLETFRNIAGSWANLGVIYSRNGLYDLAIGAYSEALEIDSSHQPSLSNLAAIYRSLGDHQSAVFFERRIHRYRDQNPYYHYQKALAAYNNDDLEAARMNLERAIRLKRSEHKFFRLQGLIAEKQGNPELALSSFAQARNLAVYSDAKSIYSSKIALLSDRL
jgi:tetratricopeptide (TPR) repeat protein